MNEIKIMSQTLNKDKPTNPIETSKNITDLEAQINRLKSQKAALETKLKMDSKRDRMQRTRTLIQVGGLVSLSGLLDRFGITLGDDLQLNQEAKEKSKIITGVLMSVMEQLPPHLSDTDLKRLSKKGESVMTTRAIMKDLIN